MEINVEAYYQKYGPMVLRRCRNLLKNENNALDAMQEVFVQLTLKKVKIRDEYPSSLLYTMATNTSLNMIRSQKHFSQSEELLDQIAQFDENIDRFEIGYLLDKMFRRQKKSTRVIATLHYVDGMTLEEVSKEVKMSVSGIRKRLRSLKTQMKKWKEVSNE